jgi:hypothetical protein
MPRIVIRVCGYNRSSCCGRSRLPHRQRAFARGNDDAARRLEEAVLVTRFTAGDGDETLLAAI